MKLHAARMLQQSALDEISRFVEQKSYAEQQNDPHEASAPCQPRIVWDSALQGVGTRRPPTAAPAKAAPAAEAVNGL